ncbi:YbaB/EbfC family nucleoid-associated protein [Nonomuraea sp. NPDC049152]|uniref:YbaB/EbfC family nucleoid-associated protein n=1 Tax=Nonomuraea sp. NPDC049152 TaxID=3154350 RepID=UPI0033EAB16D
MSDFRFDSDDFDPDALERVSREAEQTMRRLADVEGELGEIRGAGTGADGLIGVVTDGNGRVEKIELNPRVMRLDSPTLAEELMKAIRDAQDDGERKARELLNEATGSMKFFQGTFDPAKVEERLMRSHEFFADAMEGMANSQLWRRDRS